MKTQNLRLFKLPPNFRGKPAWFVQLWWLVDSTLFRLSPQLMYQWRNLILKLFGASIGQGVKIRPSVKITYPWKVSIGDFCWIGDDAIIYSLGNIKIGNNTVISQKSYICAASHDYTRPTFDIFQAKVEIGKQVWIATDVYIGPGVKIGDGTVVGARSSVFNNLPENSICIGSPAVKVKRRNAI